MGDSIELGRGEVRATLPLSRVNRHLVVTGATGTGKTVSILGIAGRLAASGVPVFFPDVKGDAVAALAGSAPSRILSRFKMPARLIDPVTMSRALGLTSAQASTLEVVWEIGNRCDKFATLDDVRAILHGLDRNPRAFPEFGQTSPASVRVLLRSLLAFERHGGAALMGEPAFDVATLCDLDSEGRGIVNVLPAERLARAGDLYPLALLYVLDQITERFPECGDLDRPRVVLVFDEAHLIFRDATPESVRDIARKVRLLRSKGVGLIFATQAASDIPADVIAQCGSRIQHGLRASSPADLAALKVAASTLPCPPKGVDMADAIRRLGTGQAIVSTVQEDGSPSPARKVTMLPPMPGDHVPTEPEPVAEPLAAPVVAGSLAEPLIAAGLIFGFLSLLLFAVGTAIS